MLSKWVSKCGKERKNKKIRIEIQNQFVSGEQKSKVYGTKLYNDN